ASKTSREDYLLALLLRYPHVCDTVAVWLVDSIAPYPHILPLLGADVPRLLEQTANRMVWQQWQAARALPLPADLSDVSMMPWVQALDVSLRAHLEHLLLLKMPDSTDYMYVQIIEQCVKEVRKDQLLRWRERLSHQAQDAMAAGHQEEYQQLMHLLTVAMAYQSVVSRPERTRTFDDLRDTLRQAEQRHITITQR
ncbi:MAG: hypothetical protein HC893_07005, partial [Chloroflexaceae bacterium]|nr:hypothetical protein [Chloroflexaceae bacterium]